MNDLKAFIEGLPKIELHLHIEGSLEPRMMYDMARRNNVDIPYDSVEDIETAFKRGGRFENLQDFLDVYYAGMSVLQNEQDFYELTMAYITKVADQNVVHTEIFFDPQGHTERGIPFDTVINGITRALDDAEEQFGISSHLIMCFLRHLDEESALKTLEDALPHKDKILGVGLDSGESGNPPSKFKTVFARAREEGFEVAVAHAGEEGPPEYVYEALDVLNIDRIDHGNRALEDPALTQRIAESKIALTVCPKSNYKLCGIDDMGSHPLKKMLDLGLKATVNSDDPSYFDGYMNENFIEIAEALDLSRDDLIALSRNAIEASFLSAPEKAGLNQKLDRYIEQNGPAPAATAAPDCSPNNF